MAASDPGLVQEQLLRLGLKVDHDALPLPLVRDLQRDRVNLDDPAITIALLRLNAVVGVKGFFNESGGLRSVGISCAICHSTVDNAVVPGIGERLDGWANRDLNIGAIAALAPNLQPVADLLGVSQATVRTVLRSWGPGKFDAELILDGKAFRPDGKSAATLIPPAFGLAGVNLHTWTGWGSVTHWNAFVANLEMHGSGTFYDPRLNDAAKFPIAAANGFGNVRATPDLITSKLAALHFYQLAIPGAAASNRQLQSGRWPSVARWSSKAKHVVLPATCRRSTRSLAGTCTRLQRSGLMTFRRNALLTKLIEPLRSRDYGPIRKAVSITMGASQH